jgi:hypothetical protein
MANFLERLGDKFREWFWQPVLGSESVARREAINLRRNYRKGNQKEPLKSADDSIIINFCGLIVDRAVSMLFGKPIKFDLPGEGDSKEQEYVDRVWAANRKQKLLKAEALYGAEAGTTYMKILPDGTSDAEGLLPRLVAVDPSWVQMDTLPEDCEKVVKYTIAYNIVDPATGKDLIKKQVTEKQDNGYWMVSDYHADSANKWVLDNEQVWEYDFAPIFHCQNLTENGSPYGKPDITNDLILLQDKLNFVVSNTAKIIKYHAHPKTWGRKFGKGNEVNWGVDEMVISDNENAMLQNLEMQSDLGSSLNFIQFLRQGLFDIARSVDIDSLADKLGALTNFALKVLYQDAISKIEDKRGSYGEMLVEINHALLELAGMANTDGGEIVWPEILPIDPVGQSAALQTDLDMGLVSKQTVANLRGYNWEDEDERIKTEKQAGDNVGAALLRAFGQGK